MGEVYRAHDVRLERTVAVKVLPPELAADEKYRQRFLREARAASALSHPNVAHIYDVGEQDGTHYIAMELVEGENLRALVSTGPLSSDRVVDLGVQMASALEEAHSRGVVHRDIKSANAVVDAKGHVKVLDFGLARRTLDDAAMLDSRLSTQDQTAVGVVSGTVPYMSPEQALGKEVDARSDLFSLGVVLYELATGRLPFVGDTATQTIDRICHAAPEPIAALNRQVPEELERIVRKCLEKDRDRRYATARDLGVDLRNLQRDRETGTTPTSTARRPAPRRGRLLALAAAVVAVVVGAGVAFRGLTPDETSIDSLAVLPFQNETGDPDVEYLSDGITESLINTLSQLPGLKVISRSSAFAFKDEQGDLGEIGRKLGVRALLLGRMVQRGEELSISAELVDVADDRQIWGGRYSRRLADLLSIEREITETIVQRLRPELTAQEAKGLDRGGTPDPEAYQLYLRGRHFMVGTSEEMDKGVALLEEATRKDPDFALAWATLAETHLYRALHGRSDPRSAAEALRSALDKALAIDPDLAAAHVVAGNLRLLFDWDWPAAEMEFRRAIELAPGSSLAQAEYGWCQWFVGDYEKALEHHRLALEVDPLSLGPMHNIGFSYLAARRYDEAIESFRKTLEVYPDWIWGHTKLGVSYAFNDMPDEALAEAARAEELIEKGGGTPLLRSWLGVIYARTGKTTRAREALRELEALDVEQSVDPVDFASVHAVLGETEAALDRLEEGLAERSLSMPYVPELLFLDGIRDEPRFQAVVEHIGLPSRTRS
jgi:serine/threonine protein kinase/tetratricopeptide (TPR) repeat protein